MYVSSLMLSSENTYGTRPCKWCNQSDLNSLLFAVWLVFSWLYVYLWKSLLSFSYSYSLRVFFPKSTLPLICFLYLIRVCVCVSVSVSVCLLEWFLISLPVVFSLCTWECVSWDFFLCVYIYISMYVCFHLCVPRIHILFNFGLNLHISFISFIWSCV